MTAGATAGGVGKSSRGVAVTARRKEVIDVAAAMIAKYGYDGTKVAAIAEELGILSGSLYHHIRSKQDLLFWIMEQAHLELQSALRDVDLDVPADQALGAIMRTHIVVAARNLALGAVTQNEIDRLEGPARDEIMSLRRSYEQVVRGVVRRGQEDGTFRSDVPERLAALAATSMANSIYRWFQPGRSWTAEMVADHYATIVVEGLRNRPAARPTRRPDIPRRKSR